MSPFTKTIIAVQIVTVFALFSQLWVGEGSVAHIWQLNDAIEDQRQVNQVLIGRNELLMAEVSALQNGVDALEERARLDLGMIKPNETFFQIID
ncbi:MAG: septum formation initiator family protein [Pseudomonadales bacterium]|nr:septum formation initiator family protein [Pseudomonadales bacterium]